MRKRLLSLATVALVASACSSSSAPSGGYVQPPDPGHHQPTTPHAGRRRRRTTASPSRTPGRTRSPTPTRTACRRSRWTSTPPRTASPSASSTTGNLPDPASIRVEEWINAFEQGYEPPRQATFAVQVDGAATPFGGQGDLLLRIGIKARDSSERARPDAALTFVIDTSGSMEREGRLELVKDSLRKLVLALGDGDSIAVVAFNDSARVVLAADPGDRRGTDPRRDRRPAARWLDQRRGRPPARLRAGPRDAPRRRRDRPDRARLRRRRQRRADRRGRHPAPDPRRRRRRHRAGLGRRRDGQLQRRPARAAGRPGRRLLRLCQRPRRGPPAVQRGPRRHHPDRRARRQGPGPLRPGRRRVVPADRLREPGDRRPRLRGTRTSMPARSAPATP